MQGALLPSLCSNFPNIRCAGNEASSRQREGGEGGHRFVARGPFSSVLPFFTILWIRRREDKVCGPLYVIYAEHDLLMAIRTRKQVVEEAKEHRISH